MRHQLKYACTGIVAKVMSAMGMKVLSTRSSSTRAELEQLLSEADVISLHCPLNDTTRGKQVSPCLRDSSLEYSQKCSHGSSLEVWKS